MLFSCQKKKILLCRSHACVTSHKFALENSKIVTTNLRYHQIFFEKNVDNMKLEEFLYRKSPGASCIKV